jgi:uncharacterized protein YcgI (DUF1989 family)
MQQTSEPQTTLEVAGYSGKAVRVDKGYSIRLTDLQGSQIGDIFALSVEDPFEHLSPSETRSYNLKLFPEVGESFYSNRQSPILTFVEDRSPGIHDMLFASCSPLLYRLLGAESDHPNCRQNFFNAIAEVGLSLPVMPDPVNIFQNTPVRPDGKLSALQAPSKAGDYVVFKAEMDIFFVVTACSMDVDIQTKKGVVRLNGGKSTPLKIEVFSP